HWPLRALERSRRRVPPLFSLRISIRDRDRSKIPERSLDGGAENGLPHLSADRDLRPRRGAQVLSTFRISGSRLSHGLNPVPELLLRCRTERGPSLGHLVDVSVSQERSIEP